MKTNIRHLAAVSLLSVATLAGCSRSEPDEAPVMENSVTEETPAAVAPAEAPAETTEAAKPDPVRTAPPEAAEQVAPDEQVQEDADATGMTARVQRDGAAANEMEQQ